MFLSYLKIALRHMRKNKLFTTINIIGLAVGLAIYVFAGVVIDNENNGEQFFSNNERIYTVGLVPGRSNPSPVSHVNFNYSAVGPIVKEQINDLVAVARVMPERVLITIDEKRN